MAWRMRGTAAFLLGTSTIALVAAGGAQAQEPQTQVLDPITVLATKTEEKAIESLSAVSTVRKEQIERAMPSRPSDLFVGMPGVWIQERGDNTGTTLNLRGLQDFGRVAIVIDGARQNYQQTTHAGNGTFYLDPEMFAGIDVVRGPVANIYGSGAIGGVASFRTKDVDDILKPGERYGAEANMMAGTNNGRGMGSFFAGVRATPYIDFFAGGIRRGQANYQDGNALEIPGTNNDIGTGIGKLTVRPALGHEIKLGAIRYDSQFETGQRMQARESVFGTHLINDTATLKYKYSRPEDKLFDFDGSVYWNQTDNNQTKVANGTLTGSGNAITGFVGDKRSFTLTTRGADANNTSRFDIGPFRNALTYGGDHFYDHVNSFDATGTGDLFTPSGDRSVSGAFVQLKTEYSTWLQVIGAARYDNYKLDGFGTTASGERVSPKLTIGLTPIQWFTVYGTYAEGYRAPAVTETLVAGSHPPFAVFPGAPPAFTFVPNPSLKPEVGKNKEVGVNIRFDDIWFAGDKVRIKANYFVNDLEDYIRLIPYGAINLFGVPEFAQYRNTPQARIEGFEFEGSYDAGSWFASLSGSRIRGTDITYNAPIATIPPDQIAATFGVRWLDRKLETSVRWVAVSGKIRSEIPDYDNNGYPDYLPTDSYNLINVYAGYRPTEDVLASFSVDNVLNQYYIPYLSGLPDVPGQSPGVKFAGPGITYKGALKIRFGVM